MHPVRKNYQRSRFMSFIRCNDMMMRPMCMAMAMCMMRCAQFTVAGGAHS